MAKAIVIAKGDYEIPLAWIDLKGMELVGVPGVGHVGEMDVQAGKSHKLTWVIVGKPGQKGQWKVTVEGKPDKTGSGTIKDHKSAYAGHIDFEA